MLLDGARPLHSPNTEILRRWAARLALCAAIQISCFSICAALQKSPAPNAIPPSALVDQAKKLIQAGDPQTALTLLQQADPSGSDASEIHTLKGICFAMTAKPIESTAEFDQAIALRPKDTPTYLSAGLAAASFGNLNRAVSMLSKALRLDPSLPGVRYNYALVLAREARYAESEKQTDLELASKARLAETPVQLWKLKARDAYYQKKWQDAIASFQKVLVLQPNWAEAYAAIGEALYSLNRFQESQVALQKALALDPQNGTAHKILGKLYQDDGKQDAAIPEFEAAIRLNPSDREAVYRLFRIYSSKGDRANAARLQKQLQDLLAGNLAESNSEAKAATLNGAGIELEKKGDFAAALDDYDQAAKIDVTNIVFQRNAALLLCKMGKAEEAIPRLRDILSLDPDDAETLQILAVATELASERPGNKKTLPAPQSSH
jgi:tetratricopeptide (TPR) repeat protein